MSLLSSLLSSNPIESPPALLLHGATSTGKSTLLKTLLENSGVNYSVVDGDQCVSRQILFQRAVRAIYRSYAPKDPGEYVSISSFTTFATNVQDILKKYSGGKTHILVLDRIDRLGEDPTELYQNFCRIQEQSNIRNLTVVFIISTLLPGAFKTLSIPSIYFPPYSKEESIRIMQEALSIPNASPLFLEKCAEAQQRQVWMRFTETLINALSPYLGTDLALVKDAAKRVWPKYIQPIIDGRAGPGDSVKLYRESQKYFVNEWAITDSLLGENTVANESSTYDRLSNYSLPTQTKYLIIAAYLASYTPAKYDIRLFSKAKDARVSKRGIEQRKALKVNPRFMAAPTFELERMLAILHAIVPSELVSNIDIGVQISTLRTLRLVITASSSADALDAKAKWKVNVSWTLVQQLARDIDFPIEDYLIE
ncbi:origin recognition complex subunit 5 [Trichomonascus vanleenenianus]|uniref:origin recognition complex subunit 5 n=1 Tax=Trichomonascus vanleenenianus TaxID=2268995 RepID=UPI003EC9D496